MSVPTIGLGEPRGPAFESPGVAAGADTAPPEARDATASRRAVPVKGLLAGLVVVAVSAGTGAAAGTVAARDDDAVTAVPAPAPGGGGGGAVPADLVGAAAAVLPGVVSVQVRGGRGTASGSGFVFDAAGHVVTNSHVVADGGAISVVGQDGRRRDAELVGRDPASDIAVLRVDGGAGTPLRLAAAGHTRVGEPVLAVGSPLGLSGTVTAGIVSALDREVRLGGAGGRRTAVQTDASINPGNSGGPLVNARGEVVGVNTAIATLEGGGSIGIGFAIPIDRAAQVAQSIIRAG
ncbi:MULTISPECIES: S1C family serine protease [Catenuloplanes]|uniref:S1-C subfamily serine protease n=1 Tax=Catenuloplanes niger TaxID=587534 RepID=A0AAE3ZWB2_9ACTN|nr:trypsin-like peptidase domain-containing protein [Catenuloplanes niger]MDR7327198.1 S1-C subfamily serine protease [Catenuloplanes niger]